MTPLFPPNDDMIAFLRACKETPEDDAPRLVFADYLEENGHTERAQLFRVQCALARRTPYASDTGELQHVEQTLLANHGNTWLGRLSFLTERSLGRRLRDWLQEKPIPVPVRFQRGLLRVSIDTAAFDKLMVPNRDTQQFHWLESWELRHADPYSDMLVARHLEHFAEFDFVSFETNVTMFPHHWRYRPARATCAIRELTLTLDFADDSLPVFLQSVAQLQTLDMRIRSVDVSILEWLANSTSLPTLRRLSLTLPGLDADLHAALRERFGALYSYTTRPEWIG